MISGTDRYETRADGNTSVAYLSRTNSANERGYGSVLVFTARDSNRFEREDFEKVVSSFRYFSVNSASSQPGEEIHLYDLQGNTIVRNVSRVLFNSSLWEEAGSYSSDEGSSGDSSSGGSSSGGGSTGGGGGCGRRKFYRGGITGSINHCTYYIMVAPVSRTLCG